MALKIGGWLWMLMKKDDMVDRILNICLELAAAPINNSVSIDEIKSSAWF